MMSIRWILLVGTATALVATAVVLPVVLVRQQGSEESQLNNSTTAQQEGNAAEDSMQNDNVTTTKPSSFLRSTAAPSSIIRSTNPPTAAPSFLLSDAPSAEARQPTTMPSQTPTMNETNTNAPTTVYPTTRPTTVTPTTNPPTTIPTASPTTWKPTLVPTTRPTIAPTTNNNNNSLPPSTASPTISLSVPPTADTQVGSDEWYAWGPAITGVTSNRFVGSAVSLHVTDQDDQGTTTTTTLAVGMRGRSEVGVYRYQSLQEDWLLLGDTMLPGRGLAVALAVDGARVTLAAADTGLVRLFEYNESPIQGIWVAKGSDLTGLDDQDRFGWSVSLAQGGNLVAIGTYPVNQATGYVRVYAFNGSDWEQRGPDLEGDALGDMFGYSVSLSQDGQTLACGAPNAARTQESRFGAGVVRIFDWNDDLGLWEQQGSDLDGSFLTGNPMWFGYSVSLSADAQVVAALGFNILGTGGGHTHVFRFQDNDWVEWGDLASVLQGEVNGEEFGDKVELSGNGALVAVGGGGVNRTGQVRLYRFNSATLQWTRVGQTLSGQNRNDSFGSTLSLAADGLFIAVGADRYDTPEGNSAGQVQVFRLDD